MPKDVVVVVNIDAKPSGTENLDILLLSTEGAKDVAVYRDLDVIKEAPCLSRARPPLRRPLSAK